MATMVRVPAGRAVHKSADLTSQPVEAAPPAGGYPTAATRRLQRGAGNQAIQRFMRARSGGASARDAARSAELMRDAQGGAPAAETAAVREEPTGALSGAGRLEVPTPEAVRADRRSPREPGGPAAEPTRAARTGQLDADPTLASIGAPRAAESPP